MTMTTSRCWDWDCGRRSWGFHEIVSYPIPVHAYRNMTCEHVLKSDDFSQILAYNFKNSWNNTLNPVLCAFRLLNFYNDGTPSFQIRTQKPQFANQDSRHPSFQTRMTPMLLFRNGKVKLYRAKQFEASYPRTVRLEGQTLCI